MNKSVCLLVLLSIFHFSCSGSRSIRPVARDHDRIDISLGGPLVKAGGIYVPAPVSSIGYTRGIAANADAHVALHPTAALYGIMVLEAGGCYLVNQPDKLTPAFSLSPRFFLMTQFKHDSWRFYPDLQFNLSWDLKKDWMLYTGLSTFFELRSKGTANRTQQYNILISPLLGTEFKWENYQMQFEFRWYAANANSAYVAPDYIGISNNGAIGPIISLKRTW